MPSALYNTWANDPRSQKNLLATVESGVALRDWFSEGSSAYSVSFTRHTHPDLYVDAVRRSSPEGYWRLSEPDTSTPAADWSPNRHPGDYAGVSLNQRGPLREWGRAGLFDGADDRVSIGGLPASTTTFAIECWLKPDSSQTDALGLIFGIGAVSGLYYDKATRKLDLHYSGAAHLSSTALTDGVWYHIVVTVTNGAATFYVNAVADGTCINVVSFSPDSIGAPNAAAADLKGTLAEVAYYARGRALTAAEIADHYARRFFVPSAISTYRTVTSVLENGTALAAQSSLGNVQAGAGRYWYDEANEILYVRTTGSVNPDTISVIEATFDLYFATDHVEFTDRPAFRACVDASRLPSVRYAIGETLQGLTNQPTGDLTLLNADGFFDRPSTEWLWVGRQVTFRAGGVTGGVALAYSDYEVVATFIMASTLRAGNTSAIVQLQTASSILSRAMALNTFGPDSGDFPFTIAPAGLTGWYAPKWYGTAWNMPLFAVQGAGTGTAGRHRLRYLDASIATVALGGDWIDVLGLRVVSKATGAITTLTSTQWVVQVLGMIDVDAAYPPTDYTYQLDARRTSLSTGQPIAQTCGAIVTQLLTNQSISAASIDSAAMALADASWPASMGVYCGGKEGVEALCTLGEMINQVEKSSIGQFQLTKAGKFALQIFDPSSDFANLDRYDESDWYSFEPVEQITEPVIAGVIVRYQVSVTGDSAQESSTTSTLAAAKLRTTDKLRIDSLLADEAYAVALKSRLLLIGSSPTQQYAARTGPRLLTAMPADKLRTMRTRGQGALPPIDAETAQFDQVLEVEEIIKHLGTLTVEVRLGNQRGLGESVKRLAPDATPTWWSASPTERRAYMFIHDDTTGCVSPGDPSTRNQSVIY